MEKNKRLTNKRFQKFLKEFNGIMSIYKKEYSKSKSTINWVVYERDYQERIKYVANELNNLVNEAANYISDYKNFRGRPPKLSSQQKTVALIIKCLVMQSNRKMSGLLTLFGSFTNISISYKSVERFYSDEIVRLIIHNMFILLIKKKSLKTVDVSGDGTGYTLTITKHYRTQGSKEGSRKFVYSFNLIDVKTKMYVCYGSGIRSEREAFNNSMKMLEKIKRSTGIRIRSFRFDKYYSFQSTLKILDKETVLYILPRRNSRINGPQRWRNVFRRLMRDPVSYLHEYYLRENSESGFSVDKRMLGWKIWQKRDDRIDTTISCIAVIHNLFRMGYP